MLAADRAARSDRDPWLVSERHYPASGTPSERLRFVLNYAILAPSNYNTQPWLFRVAGEEIELYVDRTRALAVIDPDDRELLMSCGAALFNLRTAIRYFGRDSLVKTFPDLDEPDLLAFVRMGPHMECDHETQRLFRAIPRRRTNRLGLEERGLEPELLDRLKQAAEQEGAGLHLAVTSESRQQLAELVARGVMTQGGDKRFRRELSSWIHPNRTQSRDGVPGHAQGLSDMRSIAEPFILRAVDWGADRAVRFRGVVESAPALAVLTTRSDSAAAWLEAGQALERILLTATDAGVSASYLNHPVQIPELRPLVAEAVGAQQHYPQVVLRLGYGTIQRTTPRRPLSEVMVSNRFI